MDAFHAGLLHYTVTKLEPKTRVTKGIQTRNPGLVVRVWNAY